MELRFLPCLVAGLLLASSIGCTIRTPGPGPETATTVPGPVPDLPSWSDPPPTTIAELEGRSHPMGFAVMDIEGAAMTMHRLEDSRRVEIWRPDSIRSEDLPLDLDPTAIDSVEARIAVVELADTDPRSNLSIPPRRAIDGLLFTPSRRSDGRMVLILGSLARFNPGERWLVEAFLRDGWSVLLSSPPITSPDPEHGAMTVISPGLDPELAGRVLAAEIEVALGAWAVGITAITSELQNAGSLPEGPTVLVGMSSGGLASPVATAVLDPIRRVDSVVLMATGADPPVIVAGTTLDDDDLRIERRGPQADAADMERFVSSYAGAATLASSILWTWFADRPLLIIEAGFDAAIPSTARAELRSRLPGADHWWLPTGHFGLFAAMIREADSIVRWVREKCPEGSGTASEDPTEGSPTGPSPGIPR
ncbi:MAG: hypothetical protein CMJ34_14930 [Phycisphaerae bacterium]|nr:hypothetical protein [Phycisphaerae bacterium]